jgi:hypothetical protein
VHTPPPPAVDSEPLLEVCRLVWFAVAAAFRAATPTMHFGSWSPRRKARCVLGGGLPASSPRSPRTSMKLTDKRAQQILAIAIPECERHGHRLRIPGAMQLTGRAYEFL